MKIEWKESPNHSGTRALKVELIILHGTEGSFKSAINWLSTKARPAGQHPTSAHYVVGKDGKIVQLVHENNVAWHAGYGVWKGRGGLNSRSIGIELEHSADAKESYSEPLLASALDLCAAACKRYNLQSVDVVGHLHVDQERKTDPAGFPFEAFRKKLDDRLKEVA